MGQNPASDQSRTPPIERSELVLYLKQIRGLWAGRTVPVVCTGRDESFEIAGLSEDDLRLVTALAQRQLDSLSTQLEQIRQRAQFLFTTLLALIGVAFATLGKLQAEARPLSFLLLSLSMVTLVLALLGSVGIIVNKTYMGEVDSAFVTRQSRDRLFASAKDHLESVQPSSETVATAVTLFRDAALLTILGTLLLGAAWGLGTWPVSG